MGSNAGSAARHVVRINRSAQEFEWEIRREADSVVVHRSARMFPTRIEAILDSARAAAALSVVIELPAADGNSEKGE